MKYKNFTLILASERGKYYNSTESMLLLAEIKFECIEIETEYSYCAHKSSSHLKTQFSLGQPEFKSKVSQFHFIYRSHHHLIYPA